VSFSATVKDELCRVPAERPCCARSELYGSLLFAGTFGDTRIKVLTEHPGFAERLPKLLDAVFGFAWDELSHRGKWSLTLRDPTKCRAVWETFCYGQTTALHLNNAVLEGECCPAAFVRGAFLCGGTMADPDKEYHLQLSTTRYHLLRELEALFLDCGLEAKRAARDGVYTLYFKASESIEDFLTLAGAPAAALRLMERKVEKDLRNRVNRKVNCDTANLQKTVNAALTQCEAFRALRASPRWDALPQNLKTAAEHRLRYPEHSLTELAETFDPPLGRSALNHRIRKLMAIDNGQLTMDNSKNGRSL
jgi:DNA-binding protein WhiA